MGTIILNKAIMIGNGNYISKVPPISQKVSQSDPLWAGCPDQRGLIDSVYGSSKGATYFEVSFHCHLCDLQPFDSSHSGFNLWWQSLPQPSLSTYLSDPLSHSNTTKLQPNETKWEELTPTCGTYTTSQEGKVSVGKQYHLR